MSSGCEQFYVYLKQITLEHFDHHEFTYKIRASLTPLKHFFVENWDFLGSFDVLMITMSFPFTSWSPKINASITK